MGIERDRELDEEERAERKAGRASKSGRGESISGVKLSGRRKSCDDRLPSLPRAPFPKAPRPTVTGFMGKARRGQVPTTAPPTEADAFAEGSEKRRTLLSPSRFPLSPRRTSVPLAQATDPPTPATPTDPPTPATPTPRASSIPAPLPSHTMLPPVEPASSGDETGAYSSMSDSGMESTLRDSASSQPRPVRPPRRSMDQKLRDKRAAAASKRDSARGSAGGSTGGSAGGSGAS